MDRVFFSRQYDLLALFFLATWKYLGDQNRCSSSRVSVRRPFTTRDERCLLACLTTVIWWHTSSLSSKRWKSPWKTRLWRCGIWSKRPTAARTYPSSSYPVQGLSLLLTLAVVVPYSESKWRILANSAQLVLQFNRHFVRFRSLGQWPVLYSTSRDETRRSGQWLWLRHPPG
jgi:hypothetical protein